MVLLSHIQQSHKQNNLASSPDGSAWQLPSSIWPESHDDSSLTLTNNSHTSFMLPTP